MGNSTEISLIRDFVSLCTEQESHRENHPTQLFCMQLLQIHPKSKRELHCHYYLSLTILISVLSITLSVFIKMVFRKIPKIAIQIHPYPCMCEDLKHDKHLFRYEQIETRLAFC